MMIKRYIEITRLNPTVHEIRANFFRDIVHKEKEKIDPILSRVVPLWKDLTIRIKKSIGTTSLNPNVLETRTNFVSDVIHKEKKETRFRAK